MKLCDCIEFLGLWDDINDKSFSLFSKCISLKELRITNNTKITDKTFAKFLKKLATCRSDGSLITLNIDG